MDREVVRDFEQVGCGKCGARREEVAVSLSNSPSIGYHEMAYTANATISDWLAALQRREPPAPLSAPKPSWRRWCEGILGSGCSGCLPVLRADWLLQHPRIRACEELPREAFAAHTQCDLVVFVSHRWESATHPDLSG